MRSLWNKSERSTRNCFHAKVVGKRVHCAKGHKFRTRDGGLSVVNVIGRNRLFIPCNQCPDLDIDWDEEKRDKCIPAPKSRQNEG